MSHRVGYLVNNFLTAIHLYFVRLLMSAFMSTYYSLLPPNMIYIWYL